MLPAKVGPFLAFFGGPEHQTKKEEEKKEEKKEKQLGCFQLREVMTDI